MTQISTPQPPKLNGRYVCVVDRDATTLAALISSYLFIPGTYLPLFLLRRVNISRTEEDFDFLSEAYVAELMAGQDSVFISNAIARIGRPDYVVLAGLNQAQKSFLVLPKGATVIEIADVSEVEPKLLALTTAREQLRCRADDILAGLVVSLRLGKRLVLDEDAPALPEIVNLEKSAVVVERLNDPVSVVAINYGNSVDASVLLVEPLSRERMRLVQQNMHHWKENANDDAYRNVKEEVDKRIGNIYFGQFDCVTFFTVGLPYSVFLDDIVPCCHVHLTLKPDLFILNNLLFRSGERFGAAVVFSPVFFEDEETTWLSEFFLTGGYYLRPLIGQNATVAAFNFHAEYFPYDLLHICSHGGEVDGYAMTEEFTDRNGTTHRVEFDEVVGFTPAPEKPGMVAVHRKVFPRTLDGLRWMSPELKAHGLSSHVSLAMWKCMLECNKVRKPKRRISMSCAIKCADSIHQGQFNALASYSSPIIFNNSCWSSAEVAAFFLACGARGYIGTLWNICNDAAVLGARTFYENLFSGTVLSAFHKAAKAIQRTSSRGVYVYWGLPFATFPRVQNSAQAKNRVRNELMRAVETWMRKVEATKNSEIRRNSLMVVTALLRELVTHFPSLVSTKFMQQTNSRVSELIHLTSPRESEEPPESRLRRSIDGPVDYREVLDTEAVLSEPSSATFCNENLQRDR
jgi:hypothetical protein